MTDHPAGKVPANDAPNELSLVGRQTDHDPQFLQLVTFMVGDEAFAAPNGAVQEINRAMDITHVPQAPEFVEGVINLHGKVVPVVNLRARFEMPEAVNTPDTRVIVAELEGRVVGFIVDKVSEVIRIAPDAVEVAPATESSVSAEFITGVTRLDNRTLTLLDLDRLFGAASIHNHDRLADAA